MVTAKHCVLHGNAFRFVVPDTRSHRGPHPEDAALFAPAAVPRLRAATADLSWLLGRGYALPGALQVVGNRYALDERQRKAVTRCACTDDARARRAAAEVGPAQAAGVVLWVDGYNVLTTVEAALGGAVVLHACDGCLRDIASVHGTYRHVEETVPALKLIGEVAAELQVARCLWFLDAPVSNSGRLKATISSVALASGWNWEVQVVPDPDLVLAAAGEDGVVATADAGILERCGRWVALAREVVRRRVPGAWVVDLAVS